MVKTKENVRTPSEKKIVFRIQLNHEAKQKLLDEAESTGITQIALTSKIVEWFAAQPNTVQAAVLGLYPGVIQVDIAKIVLKQMQ